MIKVPSISWYYLYSYWTLILVVLQITQRISFSAMPSVIFICIGMIGFYIWKRLIHVPMNTTYIFIQCVIHTTPFLFIPLKFTDRDILINSGIFCSYCIFLLIMGVNFSDIYRQLAYENGNVTILSFLRNRNILNK